MPAQYLRDLQHRVITTSLIQVYSWPFHRCSNAFIPPESLLRLALYSTSSFPVCMHLYTQTETAHWPLIANRHKVGQGICMLISLNPCTRYYSTDYLQKSLCSSFALSTFGFVVLGIVQCTTKINKQNRKAHFASNYARCFVAYSKLLWHKLVVPCNHDVFHFDWQELLQGIKASYYLSCPVRMGLTGVTFSLVRCGTSIH